MIRSLSDRWFGCNAAFGCNFESVMEVMEMVRVSTLTLTGPTDELKLEVRAACLRGKMSCDWVWTLVMADWC